MRQASSASVARFGILDGLYWAFSAAFFGFIPTYLLACGMPEGVLSLLLAAYMLTSFGGAFFWGRLCDRKETNRRIFLPVFFSATLLSALAFLAAGRSLLLSSFLYLALGFLVSSLGTNLDAWMLRSFRHDSAMYGRARGTGSAGYAAAMLVGGQLIRLFGYQMILWMTLTLAAAVFLLALRTPEEPYSRLPGGGSGSLKELFRIRPYLYMLLIVFFCGLAISPVNNLKIVLLRAVGGDVGMLGIDQFLGVMTQALFIFLYGRLSGIRPYVRMLILSCLLLLTMLLTALAHSPLMVIAGTVLSNMAYGFQLPTQRQLTERYVPARMRNTAHSAVDAVYGSFSGILALCCSGFLISLFGAPSIALFGLAVMLFPAALSAAGLVRESRQDTERR
ncbi:MFS transporter [Chordicoccus furentiruminis]|uniref:MFS transporter n=1 Tax=Chordicoccus furentiruminis TaxID=2709410 RepID=UPI0023A8EDC9|nr:MFS transporter [Chordicoccus furentiruminis]